MDEKSVSVPYNLRLRKASAPTEPSNSKIHQKQHETADFDQEKLGGEEVGCEKCGRCFDHLEISLHSHHCKMNKIGEKEGMENEAVPEMEHINNNNKSFRRRSRKGIPSRAPFF